MGIVPNMAHDKFPEQSTHVGRRVRVVFNYNLDAPKLLGTIVRDDFEAPHVTIIKLDNDKYILTTECQYTFV